MLLDLIILLKKKEKNTSNLQYIWIFLIISNKKIVRVDLHPLAKAAKGWRMPWPPPVNDLRYFLLGLAIFDTTRELGKNTTRKNRVWICYNRVDPIMTRLKKKIEGKN